MPPDPYRQLINRICDDVLIVGHGYRKIGKHYVTVLDDILVGIEIWRHSYSDSFRAEVAIDYLDRRPAPFQKYQPRKDEMKDVNWVYQWTGGDAWKPRKPLKGMDGGFWCFSNGRRFLKPHEAETLVHRGLQACHQRLVAISRRVGASSAFIDAINERVRKRFPFDDSSGKFPATPTAHWHDRIIDSWHAIFRSTCFIFPTAAEFFYNSAVATKCPDSQCRRFATFLRGSYEKFLKLPHARLNQRYFEFLDRVEKFGPSPFLEMPTVKESLISSGVWGRIVD